MIESKIPYKDLSYYSNLIKSYLAQADDVKSLYNRFPSIENFELQMAEKSSQHAIDKTRKVLCNTLNIQYEGYENCERVLTNIEALNHPTTYTITTGHQLNLFTGPLYFLYKIISTINLCKQLKEAYPAMEFVPVYWMATEDHDFEEIKFFNYGDRKLVYDREARGAVGRLNTDGLDQVHEQLELLLGASRFAEQLSQLFINSYNKGNLAAATRNIAHYLFKNEGLVVLDADDPALKKMAIPLFKEELLQQTSFHTVNETLKDWSNNYKAQVNPREINLFYLINDGRYRIISNENGYELDGHDDRWTNQDMIDLLEKHPERFSPNVIMRPLYQELILPNLCYIGGGGEIAYWLQLNHYFDSQNITFPILLLRNSVLLIDEKQSKKVEALSLSVGDLFNKPYEVEETIVKLISKIKIDFTPQKQLLKQQFEQLHELAKETDPTFEGAVGAQERKQIKGLEHLEKRLLQAQKRKHKDYIERALIVRQELFPNNSLQERHANFSFFYKDMGPKLIDMLLAHLDPLDMRFTVLRV